MEWKRNVLAIYRRILAYRQRTLSMLWRHDGWILSRRLSLDCFLRATLRACHPRKFPLLKAKHKKFRLAYARCHLEYGNKYLNSVLGSDETKLKLFDHMNPSYVWRKLNEKKNLSTNTHRVGSNLLSGYVVAS